MKYFTKKLWLASKKDNCSEKIADQWKKNNQDYDKSLLVFKRKLSKRNFKFFAESHRHGDYVISVHVENRGKIYFQKETKEYHIKEATEPVTLIITLLCPTGNYRSLKYSNLKKYIFDYPSNEPLWFDSKKVLGTWGYDELSLRPNNCFRHEILLHSGTTLFIEFEKFSYVSKKIN